MEEARKKGDYSLYGNMGAEKDRLHAGMSGFQQEARAFTGGAKYQEYTTALAAGKDTSKFENDREFMARLKSLEEANKALEKALNGVRDAAEKGDFEGIQRANADAGQAMDRFHQAAGQAAPGAGKAALAAFMNVQTAQQIVGAVSSGIKTYVAHLDRSSIINQQGSGNIVGAEIEELRRSAAESSQFWGTIGRIGGGIAGGIIGTIIGGPGFGTATGGALGSTLFGAAGDLAGTPGEAEANKMATQEAISQQWEAQAPSAMELAGLLGRYGRGRTKEELEANNTRAIRDSFSAAAGAANEYGYSAGEGMEAVKRGARQGLGEGEAIAAAKKAFAFERGLGADRGALLELETRGRRFGMDNMIGAAWQGNQASGMAPGQFNEFLRAMQRTFEDGISKGFVRGANEIAGNFTYLAELGGGSELYKGEAGANLMGKLSSGIEGATSLSSVNHILTYRAAQSVIEKWEKDNPEEIRKLFDTDNNLENGLELGDPATASSWYKASLLMERQPLRVLRGAVQNFSTADRGSRDDIIGRIQSQFGMDTVWAGALFEALKKNGGEAEKALKDYEKTKNGISGAPPGSVSVELNYAKLTQGFATELAEFGKKEFSVKVTNMPELIAKAREKLYPQPETPPYTPQDTTGMTESEAFAVRQSEYDEALKSRDHDRIERAAIELERARAVHMAPNDEIRKNIDRGIQYKRAGDAGDGFFGQDKGDIASRLGLYSMLNNAISSNDETQVRQAAKAMDMLGAVPTETRKEWDRDNTLNTALEGSKNIEDLLRKLVALEEENKRIQVTVSAGTEY
jgi:hypothetical protein